MAKESKTHHKTFVFSGGDSATFLQERFGRVFGYLAELESEGWLFDWSSLSVDFSETERYTLAEWAAESATTASISVRGLRNNGGE